MDDLEATLVSFFRASSSISGFSIIAETSDNFGKLFNSFPVVLLLRCTKSVENTGDNETVKVKSSLRKDDQLTGLTSILSLTATPGFALFANPLAFLRAAWVRTIPDNVTSFFTASAFTLRLR
jgi:hypothetical protein